MNDEFMDVLGRFVQQSHYSAGQLAVLSGVPRRTILNWLNGRVSKPHQWQRVIQIATALHLDKIETNQLLKAAGHKAVSFLRQNSEVESDLAMLSIWPDLEAAPFQAITELPYFVARKSQILTLETSLLNHQFVKISALRGMGGVGKTALATHMAYRLRDYFPDGVLWAQLNASDTMSILANFAAAYGQNVTDHSDLPSRSALVRTILADKRTLIILDNAQSSEQIKPLLPPNGQCAVIVTTRQDLGITDGWHHLHIGSFDPDSGEAIQLFTHFLGNERVAREHPYIAEIIDLLGHLPLATAIVASQLASQPWLSTATLLAQLRSDESRLSTLSREDRSVQLSFDSSYHALEPALQQFFVALGAFGRANVHIEAVSHVTGVTEAIAQQLINQLCQLSLVQQPYPNRYSLHPLLRDYAQSKMMDIEPIYRMVSFYTHYVASYATEYQKLDGEADNILYALDNAFVQEMQVEYLQGVNCFFRFLETRGMYETAKHHLSQVQELASSLDNKKELMTSLFWLGNLASYSGDMETAVQKNQQALTLAQELGDDEHAGQALANLGILIGMYRADYEQAITYLQQGVEIADKVGNLTRKALLLSNLGAAYYEQGNRAKAIESWQQGLSLIEKTTPEDVAIMRLLDNLGIAFLDSGDDAAAQAQLQRGLDIAISVGHQEMTSTFTSNLGRVEYRCNNNRQASIYLQEGLKIALELERPDLIAHPLRILGSLAIKHGEYKQSLAYLNEALEISLEAGIEWDIVDTHIRLGFLFNARLEYDLAQNEFRTALKAAQKKGMRELEAKAYEGLSRLAEAQGDLKKADEFGSKSLKIYETYNHRDARPLRLWLRSLPPESK